MRGGGWPRAVRVAGVVVLLCVAWLQLALPPLPHDPQSALGGAAREAPEADPALGLQRNPTAKFFQVCVLSYCSFRVVNEEIELVVPLVWSTLHSYFSWYSCFFLSPFFKVVEVHTS